MAKIRPDFDGAIHVDGRVLFAGDVVPAGVTVSPEHLEAEKPKRTRKAKADQGDNATE